VHLTYCTNIHPAHSWAETRDNLQRYVTAVKQRFSPTRPFGVGLRLSALAARELETGDALVELRDFLQASGLYVFTLNGFPYGPFHGTRVKDDVYRPDWREDERVDYTARLARILAALLPADCTGSISTVPGGFKARTDTPDAVATIARNLARAAEALDEVGQRTGRRIKLAVEPEPCCLLETIAETTAFFDRWIPASVRPFIGVCLDTCHAAVEFEEPAAVLSALEHAGIRIDKAQLSSALRIQRVDSAAIDALRPFDDQVYLHQVVESGPSGLRRFTDLQPAIAAAVETGLQSPREWRVHFHVPLFLERMEHFGTTQGFLADFLALKPDTSHFEVETYTWDVLPPAYRRHDVVTAITRELRWVAARLPQASA